MSITLVAGVAENGVIGFENTIPWKVPGDMKHFQNTTINKVVIMGRKTWESLGKPLKQRLNIVVTRNLEYVAEGGIVVPTIQAGIEKSKQWRDENNSHELMIIGGSEIYKQTLPFADKLIISRIPGNPEGDTYFPTIDMDIWKLTETQPHDGFSVEIYKRHS